jgi:hypothetical protein
MAGIVIDATISGLAANSYMTDQQMSDRLEGRHPLTIMDSWDELEDDARGALLATGTRLIDGYPSQGWGARKVEGQALAFPRADDDPAVLNPKILDALVEYVALQLESDGEMSALKRLQSEGVTSANVLGQSVTQEKDQSELPAGARRLLDQLIASHWPEDAVKNPKVGGCENFDFFG